MNSLLIVNKQYRLEEDYIPLDLEYINVKVDRVSENKFLRREVCYYIRKLFRRAWEENINLIAISGFRSYTRQREIYENSIINKRIQYTQKYIAYHEAREHQT